jgi:hypothetical protein
MRGRKTTTRGKREKGSNGYDGLFCAGSELDGGSGASWCFAMSSGSATPSGRGSLHLRNLLWSKLVTSSTARSWRQYLRERAVNLQMKEERRRREGYELGDVQKLAIRLILARRQRVLVRRDFDAVLRVHGEIARKIVDVESVCGGVLGKLRPEDGKRLRREVKGQ